MPEVNVDELLEEIQRRAEQKRRDHPEIEEEIQRQRRYFSQEPSNRNPRTGLQTYIKYLGKLASQCDKLPAQTRFAGFKKTVLRLIKPFTHQQVEFNSEVVRLLRELIKEHEATVDLVRSFNQFLHDGERKASAEGFQRILVGSSEPEFRTIAQENLQFLDSQPRKTQPGFRYLQFEERFRGSEEQIKELQSKYVHLFLHTEPVLDLGCGRGEFLQLLAENGITSRGVDSNPAMVERAQKKGLQVEHGDLIESLSKEQDSSLGGIFASHVIEHLEASVAFNLIGLCFRKLKMGGILLVQSPNPSSLMVFSHSFYLDPTHVRPYHPLCLEFFCRDIGFSDVEIRLDSPVEDPPELAHLEDESSEAVRSAIRRINGLLFGPQDYSLICKK